MARHAKPYARDTPKGNPDGTWTHDLHQSRPSLASRLSATSSGLSSRGGRNGAPGSLLDRISGGVGKELLPSGSSSSSSKMHGFGSQPPINPTNANAGVELFPTATNGNGNGAGPSRNKRGAASKGRLVDNSLNAALGVREPRRSTGRGGAGPSGGYGGRELLGGPSASTYRQDGWASAPPAPAPAQESVSIMGASRGKTWVRVENLAQGTTTTDVIHAFAPAPISSAKTTSSPASLLTTIEIEVDNLSAAEEIVAQFNGVVADGNTLVVSIISQNLASRLGRGAGGAGAQASGGLAQPQAYRQPQELVPRSSSKMYSDSILASDPSAAIITLAQDEEDARAARARAGAWKQNVPAAPSLAQRVGMGRR